MRRPLLWLAVALGLALGWPAWGQAPVAYPSFSHFVVGELRCTTGSGRFEITGTDANGLPIYRIRSGTFKPAAPWSYALASTDAGWMARYGIPYPINGPVVGHAGPPAFTRELAEKLIAQGRITLPPGYASTVAATTDASYLMAAGVPCEQAASRRLADAAGCPVSAVGEGWSCTPPPAAIGEGCRSGALRCAGFGYPLPLCWIQQGTRITYSTARPECIPGSVVVPPVDPAPVCGDGTCDPSDGGCSGCPADCGVCEPEPPPEACEDVRAALAAAEAEVQRLRGIVTAVREAVGP